MLHECLIAVSVLSKQLVSMSPSHSELTEPHLREHSNPRPRAHSNANSEYFDASDAPCRMSLGPGPEGALESAEEDTEQGRAVHGVQMGVTGR